MDKKPAIILSVIVVFLVSLYAYWITRQGKVGPLESIVPDSAIYYMYSYNLDKKIKDFQSSPFCQQIFSLSVYEKFISPKLEKIKELMPAVSDFIKKDFAIAIFSLGDMKITEDNGKDFGEFLILARTDPQKFSRVKRIMADFYLTKCAQSEISHKRYKGIKITSRKVPKEKTWVSFAFLPEVIIISNNSEIIQKSIDLYKNRSQNSLANNKDFRQITARIKKDVLFWGYQNNRNYYLQAIRSISEGAADGSDAARAEATEALIKGPFFEKLMNIFKDSAFYADYNDSRTGLVFGAYQVFGQTADERAFREIFASSKPVDKNIFNLIPADSIGYYAINRDVLNSWKAGKEILSSLEEAIKAQEDAAGRRRQGAASGVSFNNMLKTIESFLGVNIEDDILPLLGDNFGAAVADMEDINIPVPASPDAGGSGVQQGLPIIFPRGFVFFELKDNAGMQEVMKGMLQRIADNVNNIIKEQEKRKKAEVQAEAQEPQKLPLTLVSDSHNGIDICRMEITDFPVLSFKPNYCILDKYLIFSLSPQLTEKVIDIYQAKRGSFSSSSNLDIIQDKLPREYSSILFFDFRRLLNDIINTKFYDGMQSQLAAGKAKDFSKEDLGSLIGVLKNISNLVVTTHTPDPDTMESASYVEIEGL